MAKRNFHATNFTPTATADTTNLANGTYMALQGGSSTQLINLLEVYVTGQGTSSAPTILQVARDSTVMATPTALAAPNGDGPMHPSTAVLGAPPVSAVAATTAPQRSAATTQGRLELGLNAFGGVAKWNPYTPDMAFSILGDTPSLGELSLSAFTGGTVGAISAHMIYEPL
jgi:hypothetical protein